jgi:hypothetical protein
MLEILELLCFNSKITIGLLKLFQKIINLTSKEKDKEFIWLEEELEKRFLLKDKK